MAEFLAVWQNLTVFVTEFKCISTVLNSSSDINCAEVSAVVSQIKNADINGSCLVSAVHLGSSSQFKSPQCSSVFVWPCSGWSGTLCFSFLLSHSNPDQFNKSTLCSSTEVLVSSKEEPAVGCGWIHGDSLPSVYHWLRLIGNAGGTSFCWSARNSPQGDSWTHSD